jgi:hypothetical protein
MRAGADRADGRVRVQRRQHEVSSTPHGDLRAPVAVRRPRRRRILAQDCAQTARDVSTFVLTWVWPTPSM